MDGVVKKDLTVLFSDIVGFTAWSSTKEADEIHRVLNQYFEEMSKIIFAMEGTIDKYMGDGLLAFFGDPKSYPDHALRAVRAAIMMQIQTKELRAKWEKEGGMPIMIRIGIHSGEVVVGNMGSRERMDYTVIGSNVNLAQRLENNCSPGEVLISKQVYEQLNGEIDAGSAGIIQAKGFKDPVPVFKVACTTLEKTSS